MSERLLFELVIPCFNEAFSIPQLIEEFKVAAEARGFKSDECKLVLVNNGSTDQTKEVLEREKQRADAPWFRVVSLMPNQGYGGGILKGLQTTQAPWVGYSHADLQCPLTDAFKAFEKCIKVGRPALVQGLRKNRRLGDWLISRFYELAVGLFWGFWSYDLNAQPKVFNRELIVHLKEAPQGITFDAFVLHQANKVGFEVLKIHVLLLQRLHGASHWAQSPMKKVRTFWKVIRDLQQI